MANNKNNNKRINNTPVIKNKRGLFNYALLSEFEAGIEARALEAVEAGELPEVEAGIAAVKDATIGAGSTIRNDAPPGKLTITRASAKTLQNWRRPKKKGE